VEHPRGRPGGRRHPLPQSAPGLPYTPAELFHVEHSPPPDSLSILLRAELDELTARDRRRTCPPLTGPSRTEVALAGQPLINFASNDYLGLATHPAVLRAAHLALDQHGASAASSRLVSGDLPPHRLLEADLAAFLGRPAALVFPSGYQSNLGVLTTLAGPDDLIVSDAANHASLIDGCRLSRATVRVYAHLDPTAAAAALSAQGPFRRRWLVTESLFSMDGDLAPLADLAAVARHAGARLIVDEAHALGVLGPAGRGWCAAQGVDPDVLLGTLGKALGAAGGFASGSLELRDILINRARTFLFTTALPPATAAAARGALTVLRSAEGDARRARLMANLAQLHAGLRSPSQQPPTPLTPIVPLILGSDRAAVDAGSRLRDRGLFVQPIRPPTVPENTARLRITVSADHTPAHVTLLTSALAAASDRP
jgi:8-amino-7-oxononanoate synthase